MKPYAAGQVLLVILLKVPHGEIQAAFACGTVFCLVLYEGIEVDMSIGIRVSLGRLA